MSNDRGSNFRLDSVPAGGGAAAPPRAKPQNPIPIPERGGNEAGAKAKSVIHRELSRTLFEKRP